VDTDNAKKKLYSFARPEVMKELAKIDVDV
jgi:hypothetical protein